MIAKALARIVKRWLDEEGPIIAIVLASFLLLLIASISPAYPVISLVILAIVGVLLLVISVREFGKTSMRAINKEVAEIKKEESVKGDLSMSDGSNEGGLSVHD